MSDPAPSSRGELRLILLSRQCLQEILLRAALILGVITALMVLAESLELLEEMAHGEIPAKAVLVLLGLGLPKIAALAFPLALFFGVLTTVSRLCLDSEMDAMAAAGFGLHNLLPLVGLLSVVGLALEMGLTLWAEPAGEARMARAMGEFQRQAVTSLAKPGRFNELTGGRVLYFRERDEAGRMQRVFFRDPGPEPSVTITAPEGRLVVQEGGSLEATFWDGLRYQEGVALGGLVRVTQFDRYRARQSLGRVGGSHGGLEALPTRELMATAWDGDGARERRAELFRRLAIPLSLPVLLILALPLGLENRREGSRSFGILWGALFVLGYHHALIAVQEWATSGVLAPHWLLWAIPLPALALALFFLQRGARGLPLLPMPSWPRGSRRGREAHEDR